MAPVSVQQFEKAVEGLKKMAKEQPADVVPMPAGEKKEKKGLFGVKHAHTELLELCNMIYDEGFKYSDGTVAIPFGILFKVREPTLRVTDIQSARRAQATINVQHIHLDCRFVTDVCNWPTEIRISSRSDSTRAKQPIGSSPINILSAGHASPH
ncbi:uncharacterized protein LOC119108909 [Pollicipes pollicipes]|uniref:uncharacterized protein LOC119108909 n=1 Tax=Pollicipes pollicipes TaxID=41117 RepID=UPI0018855644|nr:uncharacterized protein LOC119108909 [Pollicipes pollicipes]